MKNILLAFTKFTSIDLPCSNPDENLVVPVNFTSGTTLSLHYRTPSKFRLYTKPGFLQLRAATFDGDFYALCPGMKVKTCEAQHVCIGGVRKTNEGVCNAYMRWPPNGASYTYPKESRGVTTLSSSDISDNIMIFYR